MVREKSRYLVKPGLWVDNIDEATRLVRIHRAQEAAERAEGQSRVQTVPMAEAMKVRNAIGPSVKIRDCDKVAPEDGPGVASKLPPKPAPAKKAVARPLPVDVAQASPKHSNH